MKGNSIGVQRSFVRQLINRASIKAAEVAFCEYLKDLLIGVTDESLLAFVKVDHNQQAINELIVRQCRDESITNNVRGQIQKNFRCLLVFEIHNLQR